VKTVGYFNQLNPFSRITARLLPKEQGSLISPESVLWSPTSNSLGFEWGALDDVVMGGASESKIEVGSKFSGLWEGIVTTANNGGFAGIRIKTLSPGLGKTVLDSKNEIRSHFDFLICRYVAMSRRCLISHWRWPKVQVYNARR
jgi:hypothetical protein